MKDIPLQPIPNQSVSFVAAGVAHTAGVATRLGNLYLTLWRDGEFVLHNRALKSYAPVGYGIMLIDTQGTDDPHYEGLGSRWLLTVSA